MASMLVHQCKTFWSHESLLDKNTSVKQYTIRSKMARSVNINFLMKFKMNIGKSNLTDFLQHNRTIITQYELELFEIML